MIVIDIGNTNVVIGLFYNNKLNKSFRFETNKNFLIKNIKKKFTKKFFANLKLDYKICVISSVVPPMNKKIINFFDKNEFKIKIISYLDVISYLKIKIDNPKQLGNDRIANCVAALNIYGQDCLIIDFGTATTFDVIKNKNYVGGVISPGVVTSHNSLIKNAHNLKKISITKINKIVGKNTANALKSGFFWGYSSLINRILTAIIKEKKFKPYIILTGGLAKLFKDKVHRKNFYEPNLTLKGLYFIGLKKYG